MSPLQGLVKGLRSSLFPRLPIESIPIDSIGTGRDRCAVGHNLSALRACECNGERHFAGWRKPRRFRSAMLIGTAFARRTIL